MNKKVISFLVIIVALVIIGALIYWHYFQETFTDRIPPSKNGEGSMEEVSPKVVDGGGFTKEEINALTNITPEKAIFYSIEYKNESFNFSLFEFLNIGDAQKFFKEDILAVIEKESEKISAEKSSMDINGFSGYIYTSLQKPEGSAVILQKEKTVLNLNTGSTDENNIKTIIKWFIQNHVKS